MENHHADKDNGYASRYRTDYHSCHSNTVCRGQTCFRKGYRENAVTSTSVSYKTLLRFNMSLESSVAFGSSVMGPVDNAARDLKNRSQASLRNGRSLDRVPDFLSLSIEGARALSLPDVSHLGFWLLGKDRGMLHTSSHWSGH